MIITRRINESQETSEKLKKIFCIVSSSLLCLFNSLMSRHEYKPENLELIANDLLEASKALNCIVDSMRSAGLECALIHGTLPHKTHLPAVLAWVDKIGIDVKSQIRAKREGVPSSAELHKQKSEKQKQSSARKKKPPG